MKNNIKEGIFNLVYSDIFIKYSDTIFFYFIIICTASISATLSYRYKNGKYYYNKLWLIISFGILLCFLGFASVGTDYFQYSNIFDKSLQVSYWKTTRIEKGFLLFNSIIRIFTSNFEVFHFLWALVILLLIYSTIIKFRRIISPGWAILAYSSVFMFQSLDLMRMYLAIAIAFWGVRYIINKKYYAYAVVIVVASLIHKTALCLIIPFVIWRMFSKNEYYLSKTIVSFGVFIVVYFIRGFLFDGTFLGYSYKSHDSGEIGVIWIAYHLPILAIFIYYRFIKKKYINDDFVSIMFIFLCSSAVMWCLSYFIEGIGRATFYFTYPFIILPQYLINQHSRQITLGSKMVKHKNKRLGTKFISIAFIIYYIFRAYMMIGYLESDGLQIYRSIFN